MSELLMQVKQGVAVLTINNPPVNAASAAVRSSIVNSIRTAASDDAVTAIVLIGGGRSFIAGADIREFGKPPVPPSFPDVIEALESSNKPVVAALHGNALGGGLEIALGCHYRVALPGTKVGLPEVNLGLLPGAGGTQRLPRIIGPAKALDIILSGKPIPASEAQSIGVIDELIDGSMQSELEAAAIRYAATRAKAGGPYPLARQRQDKIGEFDRSIFDKARAKNARKWKGLLAQWKILECVEAACTQDFEAGSEFERQAFMELRASDESSALRYAFFAEREAAKIPGLDKQTPRRDIQSAAVIGAGTMGGGIAMVFANSGIPVKLLEIKAEALTIGLERIRQNYDTSVARGSLSEAKRDRALALIETTTSYEDISHADIVVEAVFENMGVKQEIFGRLDQVMKPGAILASNTSTLSIDEIASATKRPGDVIGTHFFSPANVMKLQENVRGKDSSDTTIASVMALAKRIGKVPVLAGNCTGFIGNRILHSYGRECDFMLEDGAMPWDIDRALKNFGFPMGLYLMRDLAGLDVGWRVRQGQAASRDPSLRYSVIADRLCERGHFGQKTGAGYYLYEGRQATPAPETEALILDCSKELGITRRQFSDEEIVMRVMATMVNEGAKILEQGIALRASDIDVTYLYGYGFPRYRGGPMYWAEQQGLDKIADYVQRMHAEQGHYWTPSKLLLEQAESGHGWSA